MKDHKQHLVVPILDLQRLKVISALGRGATGVVFLVVNEESSESLALKVILRESIEKKCNGNDDQYKRVWFEQQSLMCFKHPLLPRLRGVLSTDKVVGYAIDYCPGQDLNSLRNKQTERMFSDHLIRFYAAEMVLALEYLHNLGIAYRDLKPENIMIQDNGHIMLVDFDLSKKLTPKTPKASPTTTATPIKPDESATTTTKRRRSLFQRCCNSGISPEDSVVSVTKPESEPESCGKSNSFVGTEEYVAPEMILGNGHDFSVDWWSLGIVLYEMLYGVTPFKGTNRKETFYRVLTEPARLVGEATLLRDLISKLLEKDPVKRIRVEEIKGHDFFRGIDWDLVLTISRPPYIPLQHLENGIEGKEGIKEIDVELFVQRIFQTSGECEKNKVDEEDTTNKYNEENNQNVNKGVWVNGLNNNPSQTSSFSVF
ncbi:hypothetical protein LWI28_012945 [Acer negundo]|uniref:non-specific serine/threonine protein kinase n=1 Tax=Acer negundo TaxID=4023 RepID=A0AAD5IUI7_ACENE|nr:hypothetical protein LWI28_012945 [Acer negundo]KAK4845524.1 hypothetical protein QYF36_006130 [Acer negundo]